MNIVPFPIDSLNDLPAQLRRLADMIETGEITADAALCVVPQDNALPIMFMWGENYGPYADIAMLELAKASIIAGSLPNQPGE